MKLIREEIESVEFLVEQKNGKKSMYIEGVFLQGNIKNRNGRMYPMETLRKEVGRYNENHIQAGRALGELGHPDGPTVNLDRVSHKIVSLKESGSNFIGKAKLLNTPMGKIASSLVEEGVKLGVSSRGIGSLKMTREGVNIVGDDFMLATAADIVADPSAPDAFVEGIMEGKEWVWEGGILRERIAEQTKRRINTLVDQKALEEHKLSLFNDFLYKANQDEEEEEQQPQLYTIKVDGEDVEVTLDELQNGYSRQRDYTRKTQELAEQRTSIEAKQKEISEKDAIYSQLLPKMEATLKGELENEPDWNALYEADPIAYVREKDLWNEKKQKLQAVQDEATRLQQEEVAKQQKELEEFIKHGNEQLLKLIPEWQDSEVASKEKMAIRNYGINVLGYTAEQMDQVYDYRHLLGLRNAWMYDKTLKATKVKPTEKKAVARTARPGTSNVPKSTTPVKKAKQRLAKSGKVQDAAKLFEQII